MKPVFQTRFHLPGEPPGNCFPACIASLLEVSISDVPQPGIDDKDDWSEYWTRLGAWLEGLGFHLIQVSPGWWSTSVMSESESDLWIGSGPGPRGHRHSVVMRGAGFLVHDPHPSGVGLLEVDDREYLVPLDVCVSY